MTKVLWCVNSEEDKSYPETTWYRCHGGEKFVEKVENKHNIVGVVFEDNNIGFILEAK